VSGGPTASSRMVRTVYGGGGARRSPGYYLMNQGGYHQRAQRPAGTAITAAVPPHQSPQPLRSCLREGSFSCCGSVNERRGAGGGGDPQWRGMLQCDDYLLSPSFEFKI